MQLHSVHERNSLSREIDFKKLKYMLGKYVLRGYAGRQKKLRNLVSFADEMSKRKKLFEKRSGFPADDIIGCLRDEKLQSAHSLPEAWARYSGRIEEPHRHMKLVWFYFRSPPWTWSNMCGREGWMVSSRQPLRNLYFFCERLN